MLISSPPASKPFKMMVVIQPNTPDCHPLPGTRHELNKIEAHVPNDALVKFGVKDAPALVDKVFSSLLDISIAHFACHGQQDITNPLESAFIFGDGPLKVSRIMEQPMPNASLAFLSACQTAMGDINLPDEAFHLAAALLFAGFRGTVATMWLVE
jgi:CHAT domain-containing protein